MTNLPPPPGPPSEGPYGHQQQGYGYSYGPVAAQPAGFWIRVAAAFLDGIIIGIPLNIVVLAAGIDPLAAFVLRIIAYTVYYAILEGGPTGQTVGKRACSIRVVDFTTFQPGIGAGRAIGRYFAKFLSAIALGLGYLWMLWDPNKQTWHDKLANTRVVKA